MALDIQESLIFNRLPTAPGSCLESITKTLEDFGLPPTKTLDIFRQCRGYLAGSAVLLGIPHQGREHRITPGDLDVFVPLKYSEILKTFLLEGSGERRLCRELDLQQSPVTTPSPLKSHPLKSSTASAGVSESSSDTDANDVLDDEYDFSSAKKSGSGSPIAKIWYFRDNQGREINVIVSSTRYALYTSHSQP
jgi:hypothetical protein